VLGYHVCCISLATHQSWLETVIFDCLQVWIWWRLDWFWLNFVHRTGREFVLFQDLYESTVVIWSRRAASVCMWEYIHDYMLQLSCRVLLALPGVLDLFSTVVVGHSCVLVGIWSQGLLQIPAYCTSRLPPRMGEAWVGCKHQLRDNYIVYAIFPRMLTLISQLVSDPGYDVKLKWGVGFWIFLRLDHLIPAVFDFANFIFDILCVPD
jgi:hypothetical protein